MSIVRTIENAAVPASIEERSTRATILTPKGGTYSIEVLREALTLDTEGSVIRSDPAAIVSRNAADIVAESVTVTVGGKSAKVSAGLVMAALPLFFDRWAQEDAQRKAGEGNADSD